MGKPTQTVASAWPELTVRPFVPSGRGIVGGGGGDEWGEVGGGWRRGGVECILPGPPYYSQSMIAATGAGLQPSSTCLP